MLKENHHDFLLLKAAFLRLQNINLIYQNHSGDQVESQAQAFVTSIKIRGNCICLYMAGIQPTVSLCNIRRLICELCGT